ncbi:hypothetical protein PR202_ga30182 [Eleusine coracana subsp. coracana]|uniref:Uncharacterized protein n=1 Tax=Eleusine coracana subsp. coracana TaxID=191504 RepID=A0AAV5DNM4_ELECO|nr:hypothetical protein PR202_ga30182 [Eleusine coracana subsp. coracana]
MDGEVESSKRRERLLALRSAAKASPATAPPPIPSPAPSLLPEPDLAGDHHAAAAPRARQPHRFVYYTNPAAAFSSSYSGGGGNSTYPHKRKSPPACYASRPAPHPPRPQPYGAPGNISWQSPIEFQTPMSGPHGTVPGAPPHWGPHFVTRNAPDLVEAFSGAGVASGVGEAEAAGAGYPAIMTLVGGVAAGPGNCGSNYMAPSPVHPPSQMPQVAPGSSPWRSPMEFQDPISGYRGAPPGAPPWGPHSAGQASFPNSSGFGFRQPHPGQGGSLMNYGPRCNPHASYRRGRGQNYNSSTGIWGRGGRGGVGFHNYSGQDRGSYFNKTMVDDPWQDLQPIVGNIFIPKSWLPESLREKKETPAHGQIESTSSGLSLAEYLDLSFNEASKET